MTLSSTNTKRQYNGDGATTSFPTTFKFLKNADVKVIHRDASGNDTTWVEGTDYTLTGAGADNGGPVVATTAPAVGETLTIKRAAAETQGAALPLGGSFPSTTVEQALDLLTMLVQQRSEELGRALTGAEADPDVNLTLPSTTARALKFLAFDASGNVVVSSATTATLTPVSGFIETLLDDVDAATARATLDAAASDTVNTFTKTQSWSKGTDIASANPLVLGTDGNYFDVTGATGFTSITVAAGTLFMVQFDGALTLTHGASLDLPGERNITTAAGDRLIAFAEAANTVQVLSYHRAADRDTTLAKTTAYIVALTDRGRTIRADATSASFTITLPAAATAGDGFEVMVVKTTAANTVTIDANGAETIDAPGGTRASVNLVSQFDRIKLVCDGTKWVTLEHRITFDSGIQTLTLATTAAHTHNLGVKPSFVIGVLECQTAEFGYAIGDEVPVIYESDSPTHLGVTVAWNSTQIHATVGATFVTLIRKDAPIGTTVALTLGSWRYRVRASV